jgi:hypothetical protein
VIEVDAENYRRPDPLTLGLESLEFARESGMGRAAGVESVMGSRVIQGRRAMTLTMPRGPGPVVGSRPTVLNRDSMLAGSKRSFR